MIKVKITGKTRTALLCCTTGIPAGFNIQSIHKGWIILINEEAAERLKTHGADLNNPQSIENIILPMVRLWNKTYTLR